MCGMYRRLPGLEVGCLASPLVLERPAVSRVRLSMTRSLQFFHWSKLTLSLDGSTSPVLREIPSADITLRMRLLLSLTECDFDSQ